MPASQEMTYAAAAVGLVKGEVVSAPCRMKPGKDHGSA